MGKKIFCLSSAIAICAVLIFCCGNSYAEDSGQFYYSKGSYAMWDFDKDLSPEIYNNPAIVGVLTSVAWRDVEVKEGVYDWSKLDAKISKVEKAGLKVVLKLITSPAYAPDWLKNNPNVKKIDVIDTNPYHKSRYCEKLSLPLFWDPIFHQKKKEFIIAAGKRYSNDPAIAAVMASFANALTDDWHVPHKVGYLKDCGVAVNQVKDLLNAGYTTEKMLAVGREIIDTTAQAFPKQALKLPVGPTHRKLDGSATKLAELILDYAYSKYPGRFFAQMNALSTVLPYADSPKISDAPEGKAAYLLLKLLVKYKPQIGLQMLSAASLCNGGICRQNKGNYQCNPANDQPCVLRESVNIGLSYKPHFIEYWFADAANPKLAPVLEYATEEMRKN